MKDNKLGNKICELRKKKKITQRDLANALNTSDKVISRWEVGLSNPSLEMIFQMSKIFKVPYNELIMARVTYESPKEQDIVKEILRDFENVKKIKWEVIKIISLVVSFLRLIISIIEMIFKIKCSF